MVIRPATPKDSLILSTLCRDVQSLHAKCHPRVFIMPQSDDFAVSFFDEMLVSSDVMIFIAEEGARAVGYVFCRLIDQPGNVFISPNRFLLIDQISVSPDAQGKGVGTALMLRVDVLAGEWGVSKVQLHSWDFNTDAHAFFEKSGYQKFMYRFWKNL